MTIDELSVKSFRAHKDTTVRFGQRVNAICGPNGSGKTNLLEAIHYLCLSKSFTHGTDAYALRRGAPFFEVTGRFRFAQRTDTTVRLVYVPGEGKRVFVNGAPLNRLSEIVGRFPVVVLSPDDHVLTAGGPEERRRFLDNILSQAHPVYLADLMTYRRALKQRNALLRGSSRRLGSDDRIAPWTEKVVEIGSRLVERRGNFVQRFAIHLDRAYATIETVAERPTIAYRSSVRSEEEGGSIADAFRARLARLGRREAEQGRTLAGPHRDELIFKLDGLEVRRYASQGQHRTFALALKLAQVFYLRDVSNEEPLFLLDDVLDNLDPERRHAILLLLRSDQLGQSIVTASDERLFDEAVDFSDNDHTLVSIDAPIPVVTD